MTWPSAGQPFELTKLEFVRPISSALSFISRAKPASVPSGESASARTTVASLPESTMTPSSRSCTVGRSISFRNMEEPPL
jgi:hypothetical protein